jgi:hypothetical protein
MQNATGGGASARSGERNDSYRAIVSELVSLIEHVRASMKLIETAVAGEAPVGNEETVANFVGLDDVTPRYVKANAALNACNADLGAALRFLLDTETSKHAQASIRAS